MKEITLDLLPDYIEKSKAFEDPKVVKVYKRLNLDSPTNIEATTFLRTWLLRWRGRATEDEIGQLVEAGHRKGFILDVVPLGKAI